MKVSVNAKSSIFEDDESSLSYRSINSIKVAFGDKKNKSFTVIKPDDNSSPLKLSKEQIGRFSWAVLHSMAAAYPKKPNSEEKQNVLVFLHSLYENF
jgi:hypothetical protein